ncbi:hypothetical protein NHX12_026892, partial [Muraenolepis orangiensis]
APEPLEHSPRSTPSAAQRRLWRYSGYRGSPAATARNTHTILTQTNRRSVLPQVNILRGKDGYGFTICSDSPVRVQAVDPGGPADQAGLQHLDTLLQLNGQPVEQWKCIDLAHAIRNSSNQIHVVVWRTGPTAKPSFEGLIHRPSYKPGASNYEAPSPPTRRRGGGGLLAGKTPPAGTRVKASNGDNYIILAPMNAGSQMLRPVYQDNQGPLASSIASRLYPTRQAPVPPPPQGGAGGTFAGAAAAASQRQLRQLPELHHRPLPHAAHANYGYVKVAPKILIFPIFVQPLDLCSRALIFTEEMVLHESQHHSLKHLGPIPAQLAPGVTISSNILQGLRENAPQ